MRHLLSGSLQSGVQSCELALRTALCGRLRDPKSRSESPARFLLKLLDKERERETIVTVRLPQLRRNAVFGGGM
jgi:hypothetical protein